MSSAESEAKAANTRVANEEIRVVGTPRVLVQFEGLLDVVLSRTVEESQVIHELLTAADKAKVFVPKSSSSAQIYHKVIMMVGTCGGAYFDTFDHLLYTGQNAAAELSEIAERSFKPISPGDLAANWSRFTLYPDPHRKLEKRWLEAFAKIQK